jgi:hypothetical protein
MRVNIMPLLLQRVAARTRGTLIPLLLTHKIYRLKEMPPLGRFCDMHHISSTTLRFNNSVSALDVIKRQKNGMMIINGE